MKIYIEKKYQFVRLLKQNKKEDKFSLLINIYNTAIIAELNLKEFGYLILQLWEDL